LPRIENSIEDWEQHVSILPGGPPTDAYTLQPNSTQPSSFARSFLALPRLLSDAIVVGSLRRLDGTPL
jgi:hypothetical protein